MNRLLPKDSIPASGKNYAYYYDLVRRFQYLKLCDAKSASDAADFRSFLEKDDVPESFLPQHWEAFLFFGVQDEHESGNPEPSIVNLINHKRVANEASTTDPGSRDKSRKRSFSLQCTSSTAYDASGVLEEMKRKAKNESEKIQSESQKVQHKAEESVLRKLQSLWLTLSERIDWAFVFVIRRLEVSRHCTRTCKYRLISSAASGA